MFLRRRATQAEYTDNLDLPTEQVARTYQELARVNRVLLFADPFQRLLPRWLGKDRCRNLTLLDLGAGNGALGELLEPWAQRRGWRWRVTHLDFNPRALSLSRSDRRVVGSVTALPFGDNSFDMVLASQMTHHLDTDDQVIRHFAEAWRVSRLGVYLTDLHRNAFLLGGVWLLAHLLRLSPYMVHDGTLSVRRGWTRTEWQSLAARAGLKDSQVSVYYGSRIILRAAKQTVTWNAAGAPANETSATCPGQG